MKVKLRELRQIIKEIQDDISLGQHWMLAPGQNRMNGKDGVSGNMYGGLGQDTVRKTNSNILDDEEAEEEHTKKAACCLIVSHDGKVLAVSRKDDPNAWGLPGGKVEVAEDPADAAARELHEETGVTATKLTPVFSAVDAQGYVTTTFACEAEGEINTNEPGVVRWVDVQVLLSADTSPFVEYNKKLFAKLGYV